MLKRSHKNLLIITYRLWFISLLFCAVQVFSQADDPPVQENQCLICHTDGEILPADFIPNDVHLKAGLSCTSCHNGNDKTDDYDEAKAGKTGFIAKPKRSSIPLICGSCHSNIEYMRQYRPRIPTDQVEQYYTSHHGQLLKKGDLNAAECVSCHSAHGILGANDTRSKVHPVNVPETCNHCHGDAEYMRGYAIPTDQFTKFASSVHGIALLEEHDTGSPACNDCHGNHGAMPPGISSISHVCGICHANNFEYFTASRMGPVFDEQELHACEECHGNHLVRKSSDEMLGSGEESVCLTCHGEGDEGDQVAQAIFRQLTDVRIAYDSAMVKSMEVQRIGMDDVEIGYLLQESHQNLIQARTLVHTFDPEEVATKTSVATQKAVEAAQLAEKEISDYSVRRRGFGIATIFITVMVVALFFKIRDMEKNKS